MHMHYMAISDNLTQLHQTLEHGIQVLLTLRIETDYINPLFILKLIHKCRCPFALQYTEPHLIRLLIRLTVALTLDSASFRIPFHTEGKQITQQALGTPDFHISNEMCNYHIRPNKQL